MSPNLQRRRAHTSHTDDWLMTYADMITLLLCFFVVFLIVSISKKQLPHKDPPPMQQIQVQVQQPPPQEKPPELFQGNLPFHDLDPADYADDPPAPKTETPSDVPAPEAVASVPVVADKPVSNPPAASLPKIVDTMKAPAPASVVPSGDRITIVEMNSAAFFDSGSATLNVAGKTILRGVASNLKADTYRDYNITVEGHTDDTPISTSQFPSNWELSTARGSAVVHFFIDEGLPAQRLRAAGYADTFPKLPNRDAAGKAIPENQAQNRRVIIKLEKIEKPDEPAPAP